MGGRATIRSVRVASSLYSRLILFGSQWFVDHPTIPISAVDTMVRLDLVGHALGPPTLPAPVRESVLMLGEATIMFADWIDALDGRGELIPGIWVEIEDGESSKSRRAVGSLTGLSLSGNR